MQHQALLVLIIGEKKKKKLGALGPVVRRPLRINMPVEDRGFKEEYLSHRNKEVAFHIETGEAKFEVELIIRNLKQLTFKRQGGKQNVRRSYFLRPPS